MAVWEAMSNRFIPTPNEGKWRSISQGFNKHANFPNCVGAVNGQTYSHRETGVKWIIITLIIDITVL
jgi:hypothetical protein